MKYAAHSAAQPLGLASLTLLLALFVGSSFAAADEPTFGPARVQDVVYEKRYQVYVRGYRKPVVVDPVTLTLGPRALGESPDRLALRALALRARGDVVRYHEELSPHHVRERLQEGSANDLADQWRDELRGLHVELLRNIAIGLDVIIHYRLVDPVTGETRGEDSLTFSISHDPADDSAWRLAEPKHEIPSDSWSFDGPIHTVEVEPSAKEDDR